MESSRVKSLQGQAARLTRLSVAWRISIGMTWFVYIQRARLPPKIKAINKSDNQMILPISNCMRKSPCMSSVEMVSSLQQSLNRLDQ